MMNKFYIALFTALVACSTSPVASDAFDIPGSAGNGLSATPVAEFDSPWAMAFLPDGHALVTEKGGSMWLLGQRNEKLTTVDNVPAVRARGQGGLGDVIVDPNFANNQTIYFSYVQRDPEKRGNTGALVESAQLEISDSSAVLKNRQVLWKQFPFVRGNGHFGHRLAIGPDGYLYITSGERQKFTPAQSMDMNLGKIVRINTDGTLPGDNPFAEQGGVAAEVWTLGHRNPLGIAFDEKNRLWVHEMGPEGGDELNLIVRGENYGYPDVSEGSHYGGKPIPAHSTEPSYKTPAISWVPSISPAGLVIYDGNNGVFADWHGDGFMGGLSSRALVRVDIPETGEVVTEVERYSWDARVREVEQAPDGVLYVLEDGRSGRLLRVGR